MLALLAKVEGRVMAIAQSYGLIWGLKPRKSRALAVRLTSRSSPELVNNGFTSPTVLQRALNQSVGGEGAITFEPENSDWIFNAFSAVYGRTQTG